MTVHIEGDRAANELRCELLHGEHIVRAAAKSPSEKGVTFEGVEPGPYHLRLRGREPLQIFETRVTVEEGRVAEIPITIVPHALTLSTYLGNEKLPDAIVWLQPAAFRWESSLKMDTEGHAATEIWQPGRFVVSAETTTIERHFAGFATIEDVPEPDLTVRLPDRKVGGVVIDENGSPVAHADVILETSRPGSEQIKTSVRARTADDGRFTHVLVAAGKQKLTATAEGFLPSEALEFDMQEGEADRNVPIHLRRGIEQKIVVVDRDDLPLGDVTVAETAAGRFIGYRTTDFTGALSLELPAGEQRTLFIIPRNGSFAIARINAAKESEPAPLRIVVPPPLATLEVTTRTRSGAPAANIWFLLRYNGEVIPLEVLQLLDRVQGLKFFTGQSGFCRLTNVPIGRYDLWPVIGGSEAREILLNRPTTAPVRLDVTRGENSALLTFEPAGP